MTRKSGLYRTTEVPSSQQYGRWIQRRAHWTDAERAGLRQLKGYLESIGFVVTYGPAPDTTQPLSDCLRAADEKDPGKRRWALLTGKSYATLHRASEVWEHGIDLGLWREMEQIVADTGRPGVLAIYEFETNTVCMQRVKHLAGVPLDYRKDNPYFGPAMAHGKGMIFWPRSAFVELTGPVEIVNPRWPGSKRTQYQPLPPQEDRWGVIPGKGE